MSYQEILFNKQIQIPLLAALQLLPLLFFVAVLLLRKTSAAFYVGVAGLFAEMALAILVFLRFDSGTASFQFAERLNIWGAFQYHAGVDGISVLFILLTALLSCISVLYGYARSLQPAWRFAAMVLIVESAIMSQFVTLNLLWFVLMSVVHVVLVGYLVWGWATATDKTLALTRYLQFMSVGLILLLAGVILLGWNHAAAHDGRWSFDLFELGKTSIAPAYQSIIFFMVFYGLAIRVPLFPLHGWLTFTVQHGTVAVAPVFLVGLKTGIYGMLRFVFPLMHDAVVQWYPFVAGFAVAGIFYAAILALIQVNMRRLLAYAVVSHTGILVIGLFSLSTFAFQGGVMMAASFGLAIAGLFFMAGLVYKRTRTMMLSKLGGLYDRMTLVAVAFLIAGLSIVGMPGTPGFDAVHLVLEAAIHKFGGLLTIFAALGNVVAAGFLLRAFQRAFLAPRDDGTRLEVEPLSVTEKLIALTIIVLLLATGFYFEPWLQLIEKPLQNLGALYSGN